MQTAAGGRVVFHLLLFYYLVFVYLCGLTAMQSSGLIFRPDLESGG